MSYKILVADDEKFNREIVKDAIMDEEHDYEILGAGDGLAVINMLDDYIKNFRMGRRDYVYNSLKDYEKCQFHVTLAKFQSLYRFQYMMDF